VEQKKSKLKEKRDKVVVKARSGSFMTKMFLLLPILFLEFLLVLKNIPGLVFGPSFQSFESYAERDEHGCYKTSYSSHKKVETVVKAGIAIIIFSSIVYVVVLMLALNDESKAQVPDMVSLRAA